MSSGPAAGEQRAGRPPRRPPVSKTRITPGPAGWCCGYGSLRETDSHQLPGGSPGIATFTRCAVAAGGMNFGRERDLRRRLGRLLSPCRTRASGARCQGARRPPRFPAHPAGARITEGQTGPPGRSARSPLAPSSARSRPRCAHWPPRVDESAQPGPSSGLFASHNLTIPTLGRVANPWDGDAPASLASCVGEREKGFMLAASPGRRR